MKKKRHKHRVKLTKWGDQPLHAHPFKGVTSFDVDHRHYLDGVTDEAPSGFGHQHEFTGVTTLDAEHTHTFKGVTTPAIFLPDGTHYHELSGTTEVAGTTPHTHHYQGVTSRT